MRVGILTGALVAAWALAFLPGSPAISPGMVVPPWWLLAVLVAAAELWVFAIRVRREEQAVSMSELPLVIGLFTLSPLWLLAARVLGSGAVFVGHRRSSALKTALNVGLVGAGTAVAAVVFHALSDGATVLHWRGWVAAALACAAAGALDGLVLSCVIGWYDGWPSTKALITQVLQASALPVVVAVSGLVATLALSLGPAAVPLLIIGLALVLLGYRSYAVLLDRHARLERLFGLSGDLHRARTLEDIAAATVGRAVELLRAGSGEFILARDGNPVCRWRVVDSGPPRLLRDSLSDRLDSSAQAVLSASRRRWVRGDAELRAGEAEYLSSRGLREALVIPLAVADDTRAALVVGDRLGEWRGYQQVDEQLLEIVANHATVALRHAHAVDRLTYEAQHDQLTGLPNRAAFQRAANAAMAEVPQGRRAAIGVLDLDGFKTLNDSLGHQAGDRVIAEVGRRMGRIADHRVLVARLGGDEFAILIREHNGEEDVLRTGRRLLGCLSGDVVIEGKRVHLAGSLGLALAPRDGDTADAVLRCADLAMYAAKRGSGGMVLFGHDPKHPASDPVALAADLRLALTRGEMSVAVQPLVDLRRRQLHSVEVLARWRHAVLGQVEPESFVAAAERGGLSIELTRVVLDAALAACKSWSDQGLQVRVAVNLSARTFDDPDLPERVEAALAEHGVPGRLLALELTEGGLLDNPDRVRPVLRRLRELGIRLAIDDFGTGYSSMTYVSSLAPDQVKIDKTFIQRLLLQGRDAAIVRSIIDLGNNLGVEVVAEGVSDPLTARAVQDLGCALGQGFLYAEPMPWQALPGWVERWMGAAPNGARAADGQVDPPEDGGSERLRLVR